MNSAPDVCTTQELWFQRRGEIAMLRYVLGLEDVEVHESENFDEVQFLDEADDAGNPLEE